MFLDADGKAALLASGKMQLKTGKRVFSLSLSLSRLFSFNK